jgi:hypothetical protein
LTSWARKQIQKRRYEEDHVEERAINYANNLLKRVKPLDEPLRNKRARARRGM